MILNTADGLTDHKVTNRELNSILNIDYENIRVGDGLEIQQVLKVGKHLQLNIFGANFLEMPTVDYAEYIYPLVESSYPVFLTFNPTHMLGHVITVIGHTMNSDKWDCEAHLAYRPEAFGKYHASASWVDHFIVNDDNFGMYTCMPTSYLRSKVLPQYDSTQRASFALAFLPKNMTAVPYGAEKSAVSLVGNLLENYIVPKDNKWLKRIEEQVSQQNKGIVARTLVCDKQAYIESVQDSNTGKDSEGNGPIVDLPASLSKAPEKLWLTEISLPDLYTANKHKLGDLLIDAEAGTVNGQPTLKFIWGWLPGLQLCPNPGGGIDQDENWPLRGHVPLFRTRNVLGPHVEW